MSKIISRKVKVLIAEDSVLIRKILMDILKDEEFIDILSIAKNGKECVDKTLAFYPDIITLDVEMLIMDGISVLEELIKIKPSPAIIILSSLTTKGAETTIKALELGAADFLAKPKRMFLQENINKLKTELITKIKDLAESKDIYKSTNRITFSSPKQTQIIRESLPAFKNIKYFIGIGVSTGGPRALQDVITQLPEDLPGAVFIVQHMPPTFTKSLADRLNSISNIRVKEAENGENIKVGYAYIAPGNYHMEIIGAGQKGYKIITSQKPLVNGHRPSVDVMMDSLSRLKNERIIAVIMTGMGSDGADGIKKVKNIGGITIAQSEETCVVYGMPKAAVAANAIDIIVPLEDITKQILRHMEV